MRHLHYQSPITGLQLTHSFAVMLMMTRKSAGVGDEAATSLSFPGSSRNTADDKAVGDLSIHFANPWNKQKRPTSSV